MSVEKNFIKHDHETFPTSRDEHRSLTGARNEICKLFAVVPTLCVPEGETLGYTWIFMKKCLMLIRFPS